MSRNVTFRKEVDIDDFLPDNNYEGVIEYSAPYALYVNYDTTYTKGKKPPYDPIYGWVQRNWSDIDNGIKRDVEEKRGGDLSREELQKAVAFRIVNSIFKHGIEGVHFAERAIEHGRSKSENVVQAHAGKENGIKAMVRNLTEIMYEHSQGTIEREAKDEGDLKESGDWEVNIRE